MPISISKLPEVTNVKDNSFMLITQDGTTKRTMCDQFVTEEEARLDEFSPTVITSKSMSKTGEGDNVDYSSSVYDAPMKDVVLKGKTMVNCIQEPSSQDVVLPYEFEDGQYVTINDTKESGALGVELKGQTLVNLLGELTIDLSSSLWSEDENNYILDLATGNGQPTLSFRTLYTLPANKTYTLFINMTSYTTGLIHIDFRTPSNTSSSSNQRYFGEAGWQKLVFTTTEETAFVRMFNRNGVDNTFSISKSLILLEGDHTNTPIPNYFTGMASCKMPILCTVGKNLFDKAKAVKGKWVNSTGGIDITVDNFIYTLDNVKKTTSYVTNFPTITYWSEYDGNGNFIRRINSQTITLSDNCAKVICAISTPSTLADEKIDTLQIEQGTQPSSYEPYKSSSLSLLEEVVLRSLPNGVCDTFNTRTGVYTQRVGAMVLNGSDPITSRMEQTENVLTTTSRCYLDYASIPSDISMKPFSSANGVSNKLICDILPVKAVVPNMQQDDIESVGQTTAGFSIRVKGKTIAECRQRLAEQPVTIQYELATPIITKINLSSTLKSWDTTTHIYSEIPENTLYPILSHSNATYPVILKPSTKYSIVANSYSNNHTNSTINFNLGGATATTAVGNRVTTITTPSTLSNELLTMSGRGNKLNNVMVIEGDVVGDEPYFEGICDCKTPILSNTGKNLFNIDGDINQTYNGWYAPHKNMLCDVNTILINAYSHSNKGSGQIINVRPNTNYRVWYGQTGKCRVMISDSQGNQLGMQDLYGATEYTKIDFNSSQNTNVLLHFTTLGDSSVGKATVKNIFFGERTENFVYEPYKSNILSCNGDKIELTEDMFEQGGTIATVGVLYQNNKESNNTRLRLKDILEVAPNTTYRLKLAHGYEGYVQTYNREKLSTSNRLVWNNDIVFTTANNEQYVVVAIRNSSNSSISTSVLTSNIVTLSEVDKTIVLRSLPKGVCDTLNIETGEYVQRIGEVVLCGNNDEMWSVDTRKNNRIGFVSRATYGQKVRGGKDAVISDKLVNTGDGDVKYSMDYTIAIGDISNYPIVITVPFNAVDESLNTEQHNTVSINNFKTWLSQNPVTVQYELATPIVTTVDVQGFPYAYTNGHVQLSSGSIEQSLTPKVEYNIATNRGGQITQNTKSLIRQGKLLNDIENKINQIIEATVNDSIMLMKLRNK